MISLAQACLLSAFVSLIVGVLIYGQNPTHAVNRMFLAVCGILFYYQFTLFEFLQASDADTAFQWLRLDAFWYLLPVAVFHICTIYSNFKVRRLVVYSMYGSAVLFSILEAFLAPYELFKMPWGWAYHYAGYFQYVQVLWVTLPSIAALLVLVRRYRVVKSREEKTGVAYVFTGVLIPVVTGIFLTLLPLVASMDVPDLTTPAAAVGFLLVGYAVLRYGIQILTASAAANEILSAMGDPLFLMNPSMEIMDLNRAALQLFGYDKAELAGKQLNALTQDPATIGALLESNPAGNLETEFRTKQGRVVPVFVSKSEIVTKRGRLVGHILICRDITDRRRMEEQLGQAQRLAAVGETAGMVGHDLRNPLQAMIGAAYVLKTFENSLGEEGKVALRVIKDAVQRADSIVNDLLEYSREVRLELSTSDAKSLIDDSLASVEIPENIRVVNHASERSIVEVDVARMKRVFLNLIKNAVEAMPNGGTLTIESTETGQSILVSITDTGEGIDERILSRIWSPLITTKAKGMGFGLPIVKRLVEAHGGSVWIQTKLGEGSTFTTRVPIKQATKSARQDQAKRNGT